MGGPLALKGAFMKNNMLQKTDYTAEIEAAMGVIRQGQGRGRGITLSPAPEIFDLYCFCGVYDKPYTLRFERQASGLFRFTESVKGQAAASTGNIRPGSVGRAVRLDRFESSAAPCAWCGNGSFHHCASYCGALVCGGRMQGNTFHCRKSCGASWVGVPLEEVTGTLQEPRMAPLRPAPAPANSRPETTVREPLRLAAGEMLPERRK